MLKKLDSSWIGWSRTNENALPWTICCLVRFQKCIPPRGVAKETPQIMKMPKSDRLYNGFEQI